MKKRIQIKTNSKKYQILIENNFIKKYLLSEFKTQKKYYIIIDSKVYNKINKYINKKKNVFIFKVTGSEKIKSIDYYYKILSLILKNKIDRSSTIICIGGGTIGDLGGFIASTILRGVRFILIPTTLLSQVDSSIGGKNGINSKFGKNLIGTFYQPDIVLVDPNFLKTLSNRQISSGYAEIVKHALIHDKKFFIWLKNNLKKILELDNKKLIYAISKSIIIKSKFVSRDENEKLKNSSSRAMLNFGHTFGHALEAMNQYNKNLNHGEAIAIGMVIAAKISNKFNNISNNELKDIMNHIEKANLPIKTNKIYDKKFFQHIILDKKNENKKINLVLLKKNW